MNEQNGVPGAPPNDVVAKALLEQLNAATGWELKYIEPPAALQGGFETFTYAFEVSAGEGPFSGPLILRVFRESGRSQQPQREAAFQNALAGLGYPVPRVVLSAGDPGIEGRPFNVMERVDGRSMMDQLVTTPAEIPEWLARVHTRLHDVAPEPVIEAIESFGFAAGDFSQWNRVVWLERYFEGSRFDELRPVRDWLWNKRPAERQALSVCHGDFHPGNVMMDGDTVSGVIDWPGAALGDAEHDVAVTLVLIGTVAGGLFPDGREMLQGLKHAYLDEYLKRRDLDSDRVEYYEVMRSFIGFVRGTAALSLDAGDDLAPRGGYPWADAWVMEQGAARIKEITGLAVPLPEGS